MYTPNLDLYSLLDSIRIMGEHSNLDLILYYMDNDITKETALRYFNLLEDMKRRVDIMIMPYAQKELFLEVYEAIISKYCEADCKDVMLRHTAEINRRLSDLSERILEFYKERFL